MLDPAASNKTWVNYLWADKQVTLAYDAPRGDTNRHYVISSLRKIVFQNVTDMLDNTYKPI